jgi:hypothetical protein
MSYESFMTGTLTIRINPKRRQQIRSRAKATGQSESEVVRSILDREFDGRSLGERIAHLKGVLKPARGEADERERTLRQNNWRK